MNRSIKTTNRAAAGFTLLEVVFGMMIAGIVVGCQFSKIKRFGV